MYMRGSCLLATISSRATTYPCAHCVGAYVYWCLSPPHLPSPYNTPRARTDAVESDTLQTLFDKHVPVILDMLASLRMETIAPVTTINMAQVRGVVGRVTPHLESLVTHRCGGSSETLTVCVCACTCVRADGVLPSGGPAAAHPGDAQGA